MMVVQVDIRYKNGRENSVLIDNAKNVREALYKAKDWAKEQISILKAEVITPPQ